MDFHIGEMNSTVRVGDSSTQPGTASFERLVSAVLARVQEAIARERRIERDRVITPASGGESRPWDAA